MSEIVHLHVHTEYSLLDGLSKIPLLLDRAKQQNMKALAITDHGGMYGAIQFYTSALEKGIKPIIGVETYMAAKSRHDKQPRLGGDQFHLLLLAKNDVGYRNLLSLTTISHLEGYHYRPRIDWEVLEAHKEGVVVTSGCLQGQLSQLMLENQDKQAKKLASRFQQTFGEDYYLEIQHHPTIPEVGKVRDKTIKLSRELGIPLVATNDVHYIDPEDAEAQDALLAIQTRKILTDENRLSMLDSPDFYLKSSDEMTEAFKDTPDAVENTVKIADKCQVEIPIGKWILPKFTLPKNETSDSFLRKEVKKKAKIRLKKITKELEDRIDHELNTICSKGFAAYFLIVSDFVNWAKQQGIRVGPGRGSAAGSLVSYILRITSINPMEHGLPFERFLNPDRPSPPDIDLDFADNRRDEVINYVSKKYGEQKVAQIITFGTMEARGSVRDIGRVLGMPYEEPDRIAKLIPVGYNIEEALTSVFELQEYYKQEKYKKLLDLARKVEGVSRHASTHAAGVVIADRDLTYYTPLQRETKGGKIITQFDMYSLDLNITKNAIGLMKMDFLGLRNLSILGEAIDLVKVQTGLDVDISDIPLDDKKVFEILSKGETTGIFQLESAGMRRVARNLKPNRFSDITAMVALYRPGPMELINDFILGKQNPSKVKYPHNDLKPILEETYGIAVYQEQCLQIAAFLSGYTLGEADNLRLAIGKKKKAIMGKEKKKFVLGAQEKGYTKAVAERVWGFIERFAGYGFNKAHSASYAMIAYQTAYMKVNYPVEYMTALLSSEKSNTDKLAIGVEECRRMKIGILPPSVNQSQSRFSIEKNKQSLEGKSIRFGLSAIKNIGEASIEAVLTVRADGPFQSLGDFIRRVDQQKVNKKIVESLIKVGAMDEFGNRAAMLLSLDEIREKSIVDQRRKLQGQTTLFEAIPADESSLKVGEKLADVEEFPKAELLAMEKQLLGFYLTEHPMAKTLDEMASQATHKIYELSADIHTGRTVTLTGMLSNIRKVMTKRSQQEMAFAMLEDGSGKIDLVVFPKLFATTREIWLEDKPILVKGTLDNREDRLSLIVEQVHTQLSGQLKSHSSESGEEVIEVPLGTSRDKLKQLSSLLKKSPGNVKVKIRLANGSQPKTLILPYTVNFTQDLREQIEEIL